MIVHNSHNSKKCSSFQLKNTEDPQNLGGKNYGEEIISKMMIPLIPREPLCQKKTYKQINKQKYLSLR